MELDTDTGTGYLFIELDPSEQIQNDAITANAPFYIDNNLEDDQIIIKSGVYQFDQTIGNFGGYKIDVISK